MIIELDAEKDGEPFNSLFEMQRFFGFLLSSIDKELSILYLRCDHVHLLGPPLRAVRLLTFNSLFEMRPLFLSARLFPLRLLSILYLRCREDDWETLRPQGGISFNSLFEMRQVLSGASTGAGSVALSILYLRYMFR